MNKQIIGELEHTEKYIPKSNEEYYYISGYVITRRTHYDCLSDSKWIIRHQPVFKTLNDCEVYKQYLELLDEYSTDYDPGVEQFYIYYDHETDFIKVFIGSSWKLPGYVAIPYFSSQEIANEFIAKAGEANVERFMFNAWEGKQK